MFGTMYKMHLKPGQEAKMKELEEAWNREMQPLAKGYISSYVIQSKTRPDEYLGMVIFDTEENYYKNAQSPEQDKWYRRMRDCLESDPEWNDGTLISETHAPSRVKVS
jgi:antibiotic biosynthesis monooxygenase (ABM) superfamily enzyme